MIYKTSLQYLSIWRIRFLYHVCNLTYQHPGICQQYFAKEGQTILLKWGGGDALCYFHQPYVYLNLLYPYNPCIQLYWERTFGKSKDPKSFLHRDFMNTFEHFILRLSPKRCWTLSPLPGPPQLWLTFISPGWAWPPWYACCLSRSLISSSYRSSSSSVKSSSSSSSIW